MPGQGPLKDTDHLTVQETQNWLRQELSDLAKATELRTRQAQALVNDYGAGKISPEVAEQLLSDYARRWGEALPGTHASAGVPDDVLLASIDEARKLSFAGRLEAKKVPKSEADLPGNLR
jgi:hypothetical protein